jgi:hypothetical protein
MNDLQAQGEDRRKERDSMRTRDESIREIVVSDDPAQGSIELNFTTASGESNRVISLSREGARRLAALILSHAARLDDDRVGWSAQFSDPVRRIA